jgi:hypothetical protein
MVDLIFRSKRDLTLAFPMLVLDKQMRETCKACPNKVVQGDTNCASFGCLYNVNPFALLGHEIQLIWNGKTTVTRSGNDLALLAV